MNFLHFRKQRMEVVLEKQTKFVCFLGEHRELCGMGSKIKDEPLLCNTELAWMILLRDNFQDGLLNSTFCSHK